MLITAHRSGSTFLGELFNRNPNVFYLFEPLAGLQGEHSTTGCHKYPERKIEHLLKYYNCESPLYYNYRLGNKFTVERQIIHGQPWFLPNNLLKIAHPDHGTCVRDNICFRTHHEWSCDTGTCHITPENQNTTLLEAQKDPNCKSCEPLSIKLIDQVS